MDVVLQFAEDVNHTPRIETQLDHKALCFSSIHPFERSEGTGLTLNKRHLCLEVTNTLQTCAGVQNTGVVQNNESHPCNVLPRAEPRRVSQQGA